MPKRRLLVSGFVLALFLFPALAAAQSISIVSGNGQLVCPSCLPNPQTFSPMVVQVNASNGSPSANTSVTWTVTQTGVPNSSTVNKTNSAGQASFTPSVNANLLGQVIYLQITATAGGSSVQFVANVIVPPLGQTPLISLQLVPQALPALNGTAGQTSTTAIQVIANSWIAPLVGVQVRLVPTTGAGQPSVSCATQAGQQAGTVLTNSTGTATCTPVFGGQLGSGTYYLYVGGNYGYFGPAQVTVAAGPAGLITIQSGNNQNVNPGVQTPRALTAQVTDLGGNPSNGATVQWTVTSGTAKLSNTVNTSSAAGIVSTYVTPTAGPVQVTVALTSNTSVKATFTVNVNIVVTGIQAESGTPQSAIEGAVFADPLVAQVVYNTQPVSGATVNFVVTSGPISLSTTSAVTDANGQAQVTANAGPTPGPAVVTASVTASGQTFSTTFNLTVMPPSPTISSVVNAAGFQSQYISPCSLATIFGTRLATGIQGVVTAFIAPQTQVANVSITFGGIPAPILSVANVNNLEQVSVQVPCEVTPSLLPVVATVNGQSSAPFDVTVLPISPGIFQATDPSDGKLRAVLVRPDGSFVSVLNPARRGEMIRMFVTGLGQTTPGLFTDEFDPLVQDSDGNWVPELLPVEASVVVGINNSGVLVTSARYAAGMVGVYEVDFQVPSDTQPGNNAPFAIGVYQGTGLIYGNPSMIPIL